MSEFDEQDWGPILLVEARSGTVIWAPFVVSPGRSFPVSAFLAVRPLTVSGPRGTVVRLQPGEFVPAAAVSQPGPALKELCASGAVVELPGDSGVATLVMNAIAAGAPYSSPTGVPISALLEAELHRDLSIAESGALR